MKTYLWEMKDIIESVWSRNVGFPSLDKKFLTWPIFVCKIFLLS